MKRLCAVLSAVLVVAPAFAQRAPTSVNVSSADLSTGLSFAENRGQWPDEVLFQTRLRSGMAWVTTDGVTFDLYEKSPTQDGAPDSLETESALRRGHTVAMRFEGTRTQRAVGHGRLAAYHNYFIGDDRSRWASHVPLYEEVVLEELYHGVDLRLYGDGGLLRFDLVVKPGADPSQVRMRLDGKGGVSATGGVVSVQTALGTVELRRVEAYQRGMGERREEVASAFTKDVDGTISLSVSGADRTREVVIEQLIWSTFLGGGSPDYAEAVSVDSDGITTVAGYTRGNDFPTTAGAYDISFNGGDDGFLSRLSEDGTELLYSTFIGGKKGDLIAAFVAQADGSFVIGGLTSSPDFPVTPDVYDDTHNGDYDGFIARLSPDGTALLYGTFFGGFYNDSVNDMAIGPDGSVTAVGYTRGAGFPTTPDAFDPDYQANGDAFIVRFSDDASELLYATFLGAVASDDATAVLVIADGGIIVAGETGSSTFPTTPGAFDTSHNGELDAFVTSFSPDGTALRFSTFIGGTYDDTVGDVALGPDGSTTAVGYTRGAGFPTTPDAFDPDYQANGDAFLSRLSADGSELLYSTFLGGGNHDDATCLALDADGNAIIAGDTSSPDFPVVLGSFDTTLNNSIDGFVAWLAADGTELYYGTFLGGPSFEFLNDVALGPDGAVTVVGRTLSPGFPVTPDVLDSTHNGSYDAFVTRLSFDLIPFELSATALNSPVPRWQLLRFRVRLANATENPITGDLLLTIEGQGGSPISQTLLRDVTFAPQVLTMEEFELRVPRRFPLGNSTAMLTLLEGGTTSIAEATLSFEVLPSLPVFVLSAEVLNTPVPRGDELRFQVDLTNNSSTPLSGDLTFDVEHQGGLLASRTLAPDAVLPPWQTMTSTFALRVPEQAPLGLYSATVIALQGGTEPRSEATFAFRVVPTEAAASVGTDAAPWSVAVLDDGGLFASAASAVAGVQTAAVWPNPAWDRATAAFALAAPAPVRLVLYDVLGREVTVVDAGRLEAGPHRLGLDLSPLPAGVYVWRLQAGERTETGRLTVAR